MHDLSIKLKLEGFDDLIKQIEEAEGNADKAAETAMRKSAAIMDAELKAQMYKADKSGAWGGLIARMPPPTVSNEHGEITARVGYKKGAYDPKNPSDGYKVVFLNYGTPRRSMHGKLMKTGFIQKAKNKAKPQIEKTQKETLQNILKGLKK